MSQKSNALQDSETTSSILCLEAKEDLAVWTRKPPFHLPPLDPNVFEKKSKTSKPDDSGRKKKKRQDKGPTSKAPNSDAYPEKREYNEESGVKSAAKITNETVEEGECEKKALFSRMNSPSTKTQPSEPLGASKFPAISQSAEQENNDVFFHVTLKKPPVISKSEFTTGTPRRRSRSFNQIAFSIEVLPSKKTITNTGRFNKKVCTETLSDPTLRSTHFARSAASLPKITSDGGGSGFCSVTSKTRRRSCSLGSVNHSTEVPLSEENTFLAGRSSRLAEKRRDSVSVQNAGNFRCVFPSKHSNREDFSVGRVVTTSVLSNSQQAVQTRTDDCSLVGVVHQPGCSNIASERLRAPPHRCTNIDHSSRKNENASGSFQRCPNLCENLHPVGLEGNPYFDQFRRSGSQPDLSQSRNCQAPWRIRRVGMCRGTENTAAMNDRVKARVLMKKFGTFGFPGQDKSN